MNNRIYIYNVIQANYFMKNNVRCLGAGINNNTKKVYFVFDKTKDNFQEYFNKWKTMKTDRCDHTDQPM